jgi:hypothetical protein
MSGDGVDQAIEVVRAELVRADGKAAALLGLASLSAAVLASLLSGRDLPAAAAVAGWSAVAMTSAAVWLCAWTLRPKRTTRHGFSEWACAEPVELLELLAQLSARPAERREDDARVVVTLSRRAVAKYVRLRWAVDLLLTAGVLAAAVPVLAVIAS